METKSNDFESGFCSRYFEYAYLLRHLRAACGVKRVAWGDLTRVNLTRFVSRLGREYAPNTARARCAVLKAFINLWSEEVEIPCKDFAKVLRVAKVPSQHVALTEEELRRIEAYQPKTRAERDIKALAMREALTGARGCDCEKLDASNIEGNIVRYVSQKTKRLSEIPVHKLLSKYLAVRPLKEYSRTTKNLVLRNICKSCGINTPVTLFVGGETKTGPKWQFVSFHTMRRTFATIMATKGVPVTTVQKWMGHSNAMQTMTYIAVDMAEENKKYAALFS